MRESMKRDGEGEVVLRLAYRPPYDWEHIHAFLATRAIPGVERADERGYARVVRTDEGHAIIEAKPSPRKDALEIRLRNASPNASIQLTTTARRVFDLAADPALIRAGLRKDPLLGPMIRRRPGLRIPGMWDPFECAVRAVLGQQVSVAAGRTFATRLVGECGTAIEGTHGLTHIFPSATELAHADLGRIGLTQARVRTLRALAAAVVEGRVRFDAPVNQVMEALQEIPGIGPWTAAYVALRGLGETDAFPAADLILRRAAGGGAGTLSVRELERRAEAWRPWRGYAVFHLWAGVS
ncbi:MAG: DNA-3-methyladenine glycosylase [Thermoanaerobaculia bacterium]